MSLMSSVCLLIVLGLGLVVILICWRLLLLLYRMLGLGLVVILKCWRLLLLHYRVVFSNMPCIGCLLHTQRHLTSSMNTDSKGESSETICEICAEIKGSDQMFVNQKCDHSFCCDCITKQVATKIQESRTIVSCPGLNCRGVLEFDACRPMLPRDLLDRWAEALTEALFLPAPKFYCPFKDCSAMLLVDENEGEQSSIRESECPNCHRLFCALCNVPWHAGAECEELQRMNEDERGRDDLLVRELANENKWSRCPRCKYYVERISGCPHITCRCQFQFCYGCGEQWTPTHGGCQKNWII